MIYNERMIFRTAYIAAATTLLLFACQPSASQLITIVDDENVVIVRSNRANLAETLTQAGFVLAPEDRLLVNGIVVERNSVLPAAASTVIQIRRAATIALSTPQGRQTLRTSAFTAGEALQNAGLQFRIGDAVSVPLQTPISVIQAATAPISFVSAQRLAVAMNGKTTQITSSAQTIGSALAEAGMPLLGNDYSLPPENERLPADGQINITHVNETILLAQKPIPFENEAIQSAEVPLDQTQILQPGKTGLALQRVRIRYENNVEVARIVEDEAVIHPPQNRILGYGTKIEIKTAVVDGVTIEYWRAVQMYVTSYSPCRSGGDRCSYGTSSGAKAQKGIAGMRYDWYLAMGGQALYIPGYGRAIVGDVCGGCVGKPWIDVAYSDDDYVPWHSWVTVYFLTPVPANIVYSLE